MRHLGVWESGVLPAAAISYLEPETSRLLDSQRFCLGFKRDLNKRRRCRVEDIAFCVMGTTTTSDTPELHSLL